MRVGLPCPGWAWRWPQVGGLLSFNVIFPSDQPDIARLLGCLAAAHPLWSASALAGCRLICVVQLANEAMEFSLFFMKWRSKAACAWLHVFAEAKQQSRY